MRAKMLSFVMVSVGLALCTLEEGAAYSGAFHSALHGAFHSALHGTSHSALHGSLHSALHSA